MAGKTPGHAARLRNGNHRIACKFTVYGMLPAHQRLRTGQSRILRSVLRLEQYLHGIARQCGRKVFADRMRLAAAAVCAAAAFMKLHGNGHGPAL